MSAGPRILFVDDDPLILRGLQRSLQSMRTAWDMVFVDGGEKGLAAMGEAPFDVVVSDMRMPQMNGAEFLNEVKARHPGTVRLVLSGHADKELILQCVGAAHQFLAKPCEPGLLKAAISRAFEARPGADSERLKDLLAHLPDLPTLPHRFAELQARLEGPDAGFSALAEIIEADPGLSVKVLKLTNTAFFGLPRQVVGVREALQHLGAEVVKALLLLDGFLSQAPPILPVGLDAERFSTYSLEIAREARRVALEESLCPPDEAFTAGLLHKVGLMVLAAAFPDRYEAEVLDAAKHGEVSLVEGERRTFGLDHAGVGAHLLSLWGLPQVLVNAVGLHLRPSLGPPLPSAGTAIHLACATVAPAEPFERVVPDEIHLSALTLRHPHPFIPRSDP